MCLNFFHAFSQKWYTTEVEKKVESIISKMTDDEKIAYVTGADWMHTKGFERLGIPQLKMSDGPQGLGTWGKSTAYPCALMLTATWNEELAYQYGKAIGQDCRARGVHMLLAPAVNIYRAPMCGRNFEYMGEDPFLASRIAVGYIKGAQDQGVTATVKHFIANNSDYDRDNISNDIDERTMQEIYLPAFRAAVQEAGVGSVMSSYNLLNGIYTTESAAILKDVLRKQWGFKGFVVSDWGSAHYSVPALKNGLDLEMPDRGVMGAANIKYYLKTGDITMKMIDEKVRHLLNVVVGFGFMNAIQEDKNIPLDNPQSSMTALNVANEGIVLLKNEKNILPLNPKKVKSIAVVGQNALGYVYGGGSGQVNPFHYVSALEGIQKQAAKNNIKVSYLDRQDYMPNILFTKAGSNQPGFIGQYFDNMELKGSPKAERIDSKIKFAWEGGSDVETLPKQRFAVRWSGVLCSKETAEYVFNLGADDGSRMYIDDKLVIDDWKNGAYRGNSYSMVLEAGVKHNIRIEYYQEGGAAYVDFSYEEKNARNNPFLDKLNQFDVVVACFGFNSDKEGEGRDRTFELPLGESSMLKEVLKSVKPVIGVVNAGGNVEMQGWVPSLKGLLWAWYGGQEAGTAIAQNLFGVVNPSGKLPMTFEKKWSDNPVFNSYLDPDGDKHVAYTEGVFVGYRGYDKLKREVQYPFGFGLSYTTFKLTDMNVSTNEAGQTEVTCKLTNTGKTAGAQVVQLYVNKGNGFVENPEKELKAFRKVFLKAGESAVVKLNLSKEAFSNYDVARKTFVTPSGKYGVMLGFSSRNILFTKEVVLP
jgi:beta-glucosidase